MVSTMPKTNAAIMAAMMTVRATTRIIPITSETADSFVALDMVFPRVWFILVIIDLGTESHCVFLNRFFKLISIVFEKNLI